MANGTFFYEHSERFKKVFMRAVHCATRIEIGDVRLPIQETSRLSYHARQSALTRFFCKNYGTEKRSPVRNVVLRRVACHLVSVEQ